MLTLEQDRACLAELESQIAHLERSLSALRGKREEAQQRLAAYKYPVLTLPNEITSEVFQHYLPPYPLCPQLSESPSPTLLSHVCRQWREIALGTPSLWRAISLSGNPFLPGRLTHISNVLGRSGCFPLSIRADEFDDRDIPHVGFGALAAAIHDVERWEHLHLRLQQPYRITIQGAMPLLRHIDLEFQGESPYIDFGDAPLLRSAILHSNCWSTINLPWTQLTSLTLRFTSITDSLRILRETPDLIHCELELYCPNLNGDPTSVVEHDLPLQFLESLVFRDIFGHGSLSGCLRPFVTPALRSLRITESILQPDHIGTLASFLTKSGCDLQEVCITGKRAVTAAAYCEAFPAIQRFSFERQYPGIEYFEGSDSDLSGEESSPDSD
ncbi:hypothetical protein DFH06DRAFT_1470874 [Mycena polygramma]|nr:hypothetical protein DFH06DRAFT_1470874 [Mycena polygramma]